MSIFLFPLEAGGGSGGTSSPIVRIDLTGAQIKAAWQDVHPFLLDGSAPQQAGGKIFTIATVDPSVGHWLYDWLYRMPGNFGPFTQSGTQLSVNLYEYGPVLQSANPGSGTLASSGVNVTGTGTAFTTELEVGSKILAESDTRTVMTVTDDTHLTVDSAFTPSDLGPSDGYQIQNYSYFRRNWATGNWPYAGSEAAYHHAADNGGPAPQPNRLGQNPFGLDATTSLVLYLCSADNGTVPTTDLPDDWAISMWLPISKEDTTFTVGSALP
jgi:hypothetical protein